MTITDCELSEYLERLARFDPHADRQVDQDGRWGLTAAGARAIGLDVHGDLFPHDPVRYVASGNRHPGRWLVDLRLNR